MTLSLRPRGVLRYALLSCIFLLCVSAQAADDVAVGMKEVRIVIDRNDDGIADHIRVVVVDAHGRSVRVDNDINADGVVDYRLSILRDALGRPLVRDTDINADGISDMIEQRIYRRHAVEVLWDRDADGLVDEVQRVSRPQGATQIRTPVPRVNR